jgi:hypothetical protein
MRIVAVSTILLGLFLASCSREERREWKTVQRENTTTYSLSFAADNAFSSQCDITAQKANVTLSVHYGTVREHVEYDIEFFGGEQIKIPRNVAVPYIIVENRSANLSEGAWVWSEPTSVVHTLGLKTNPKSATSWLDALWDRSLWGRYCKGYTESLPEDVRSIVNY